MLFRYEHLLKKCFCQLIIIPILILIFYLNINQLLLLASPYSFEVTNTTSYLDYLNQTLDGYGLNVFYSRY